jgi:aminoglycoside phosphotransferase (APT) family kinase protein
VPPAAPGGAVAAAVRVARRHGLSARDPVVLWDGANTVVHLRPEPVVARVATVTAAVRPRPALALEREVRLARWLADREAPVVPPTDLLPAGPHAEDGHVLSFWRHVPATGLVEDDPVAAATALAAVHDALAAYRAPLPGPEDILGDLARAAEVLAGSGLLDDAVVARLRSGAELAAAVVSAGGRALHGDAHPGNVLRVDGAVLWTDFEDAWHGPLEWDLLVLGRSRRHDGATALAAYTALTGTRTDAGLMEACGRIRELQNVGWTALFEAYRAGVLRAR